MAAAEVFRHAGDPVGQAGAFAELGLVARKSGVRGYDEATYYSLAFEVLGSRNDERAKLVRAKLLGRQATTLKSEGGDPKEIMRLFQASLQVARELNDKQLVASRLGILGNAYRDVCRDFPSAVKTLQDGLAVSEEIGDYSNIVSTLSGLGKTYERWKRYTAALTTYRQALTRTLPADEIGR